MSPRPMAPCGTTAAERRHRRNGEVVDQACRDAANQYQRASEAQRVARAAQAAPITVSMVDGRVVIECGPDDARMVAASILDRSYALKHAPQSQVGAKAASERTAVLHKRIMSQLRGAGVLS